MSGAQKLFSRHPYRGIDPVVHVRIPHADFELLLVFSVRIEKCRGVPPLCAVCGARATLQFALVVTSVKVVRANVDVRVFVRIVLGQGSIRKPRQRQETKADGTPAVELIWRAVTRVIVLQCKSLHLSCMVLQS